MLRVPNVLLIIAFFMLGERFVLEPLHDLMDTEPTLTWADRTLYLLDLLLITWFGYWLNDLHDYVADQVNRPDRALPAQRLKASHVRWMAWSAFTSGLLICIYLGVSYDRVPFILTYPIAGLLLWAYARYGKPMGFLGNLVVSFLIACLPLLLILPELDLFEAFRGEHPMRWTALFQVSLCYMGLIFLINLVREMVKDMEDERGDREQAGKSLVILLGKQPTAHVVSAFLVAVVTLQVMLNLLLGSAVLSNVFTAVIILLAILTTYWVQRKTGPLEMGRASKILKLIMLIGLLELILFQGLL
jgi:4-hydroxybenzoate polyprenyltransferase